MQRCLTTTLMIAPLLALHAFAYSAEKPGEGIVQDGWLTNLDLLVGVRTIDSEYKAGDDLLIGAGLLYQVRGIDWPLAVQLSFTRTTSEDDEADYDALDVGAGVVANIGWSNGLRAELGGGLSYTDFEVSGISTTGDNTASEEMHAFGAYAHAGLRFAVHEAVDIGGFARYTYAPADSNLLNEDDINAGGLGIFASVGVRF